MHNTNKIGTHLFQMLFCRFQDPKIISICNYSTKFIWDLKIGKITFKTGVSILYLLIHSSGFYSMAQVKNKKLKTVQTLVISRLE